MPQSLSRIWLHLVFSTKGRRTYLQNQEFREELFRILGYHANEINCQVARVGGWHDHVHVLCGLARTLNLPPLPKPDADGNYPAVDYARASLARKIIRGRAALGMTQRELAKQAGIRFEHLCRIETGKHIPSVPTIDKIDRALKQAGKRAKGMVRRGRYH